ncbi:MAG TPA: pitrilysin family protein, partial [Kofleriaceae bacterium]|nr:pitrilysin family protein [Kofleriaceae bacterium]
MRTHTWKRIPLALAFALVAACGGKKPDATNAGPGGPAVDRHAAARAQPDALPIDPAVRSGTLPNGLTYYVRQNAKPEKRAAMWLAVDAGAVLESDDQRGLAHFLEHMAFNGTKKFEKQEIVNYLEKIGMKFGPDVNAYTSFDETVYQLEVPTDDKKALDTSLEILHEWAQGVAIAPEEVEKERGVVLEERRGTRGAQGRLLDQIIPAALPGSKYGQRIPIGTEESLKTAKPEKIRRFYTDWYRPDLMAVVAVGDFDAAAMEKEIVARFGDLERPASPKPRPQDTVPAHARPVALSLKDPELPATVVAVAAKRPRRKLETERDYRLSLVDSLFTVMLNHRLDEIKRKPDAPFLIAQVGKESIVRPIDVWFQGAVVKGDMA